MGTMSATVAAGFGLPGLAALLVIAGLVLIMLVAPLLPVGDPTDVDLAHGFAPPSADHPLGTDSNGRDILARLVWGSRTALLGPLIVTVAATAVGVLMAVTAACEGVVRQGDLPHPRHRVRVPRHPAGTGRRTRAWGGRRRPLGRLRPLHRPGHAGHGTAAAPPPLCGCAQGAGPGPVAICARHLLPNLGALIVAQATLAFGYALVDLAALSYLGLGADQASPDWGAMVAAGQSDILSGYPQQSLYAGALIVVAVAACCIVSGWSANRARGRR
jgi:peptide/nickel transport system permease protein